MKLRNKLILSCAALAAVATTAVSTTFAWYTSNTEVKVGTITADTKNSGADLLMIADGLSTTSKPGDTEVALNALKWDTKITSIVTNAAEMTPLAYNGKVKGAKYSSAVDAEAETTNTPGALTMIKSNADATTPKMITDTKTTDDSGYLHFVLYLKNGATTEKNINMKVTSLTNVTAATALPTKSIINPTTNRANLGLPTTGANASTATSYTVNALRVAAMDLEIAKVVKGEWTKVSGETKVREVSDETVYSMKSALSSQTFSDTLGTSNSYDAHAYYDSVMNPDLDTADIFNQETSSFASLGGSNGVNINVKVPAAASQDDFIQLDFKIYLNGWDKACFDACQGQQFTFGLTFSIPVSEQSTD